MSLPPVRYTLKSSRAGKHIDELKLSTCEIREIKNDVEFSELFEQLLEKRSKYIKNKISRKLEKNQDPEIESVPENFESKNPEPELILTENKISEYLPPIIETLNIFSDSEPEANSSHFVPNKDKISSIEVISIFSDSGSETEIEEPSFAQNKIFLPKITNICSLGKNKVKLIKQF